MEKNTLFSSTDATDVTPLPKLNGKPSSTLLARLKQADLAPGCMGDRLREFAFWLTSGLCMIRDIHSEIIPLQMNAAQLMLYEAMVEQALADRPIRIVILKPRKVGISTFVQAFMVFCCFHYLRNEARLMAHMTQATHEIADIGKRMAEAYTLVPSTPVLQEIRFPTTSSKYQCHTAGGQGVGAGGTPNMLHLSEVALWPNKEQAEYTAVNAVPPTPDTMIIQESTARGRDSFYSRFDMAQRGMSPYAAVFPPWFMNPDCRRVVSSGLPFGTTPQERFLVSLGVRYGVEVTNEQLQWRRDTLQTMDSVSFKQEFPATPQEAVESRKGLVLPFLASCVVDKLPFDPAPLDWSSCVGGGDYGFRDATALISAYYVDQVVWIVRVYHCEEGLARDHVQGLMAKHTYYCDPSATAGREELARAARDRSIQCTLVPAPRDYSRSSDCTNSEWGAVHMLCVDGRLKILTSCSDRLVLEASNFTWNQSTGEPDMRRSEIWGHFDSLLAVRYLVMGCNRPMCTFGGNADVERPRSRRAMMRS